MKIDKVEVTIRSLTPLLMNRFVPKHEEGDAGRAGEAFDPKVECEKAVYKDEKGCYAPSSWLEATMREAAKKFKKGKGNYRKEVEATVFVEPEKIYLGTNEYEIDRRYAKIMLRGVLKARPRFNKWELSFTITYEEKRTPKQILKQILEEAGIAIGIGDYRPKFGRFEVVKFE